MVRGFFYRRKSLKENYKFMQNSMCEYFSCHEGLVEDFNCMFCFCPLYENKSCGGVFSFNEFGIKDCSLCLLPHKREGYDYIVNEIIKARYELYDEAIEN